MLRRYWKDIVAYGLFAAFALWTYSESAGKPNVAYSAFCGICMSAISAVWIGVKTRKPRKLIANVDLRRELALTGIAPRQVLVQYLVRPASFGFVPLISVLMFLPQLFADDDMWYSIWGLLFLWCGLQLVLMAMVLCAFDILVATNVRAPGWQRPMQTVFLVLAFFLAFAPVLLIVGRVFGATLNSPLRNCVAWSSMNLFITVSFLLLLWLIWRKTEKVMFQFE